MCTDKHLLLPCPFCGGEGSFLTVKYHKQSDIVRLNEQSVFFGVNCILCGTNTLGLIGSRTYDDAAKKWNRRVVLTYGGGYQ